MCILCSCRPMYLDSCLSSLDRSIFSEPSLDAWKRLKNILKLYTNCFKLKQNLQFWISLLLIDHKHRSVLLHHSIEVKYSSIYKSKHGDSLSSEKKTFSQKSPHYHRHHPPIHCHVLHCCPIRHALHLGRRLLLPLLLVLSPQFELFPLPFAYRHLLG